jgi:hypothetical protein
MVTGLPDIDPKDWQANTTYTNGYTESSPIITWFWKLVTEEFTQEEKTKLLQYCNHTKLRNLIFSSYWNLESANRRL